MRVVKTRCPTPEELSRAQAEGAADALAAHLEGCASCAALWRADRLVATAARESPVRPPSPDQSARMREAMLAAAHAPRRDRRWTRVAVAATLCAASAAAGVAIGSRFLVQPAGVGGQETPVYRGSVAARGRARFVRLSAAPDEVVRLLDGTISLAVTPLAPGERFRVVVGDGEIEVRGTAFDVEASGDHLTAVRVAHGRVEVRAGDRPLAELLAGQSWTAPAPSADGPAAPPVASAPAPPVGNRPSVVSASAPHSARPLLKSASVRPSAAALVARPPHPAAADDQTRPSARAFHEGWAALSAGRAAAAAEAFERAVRADAADPLAEDARFWVGVARARAGDSPAAIAALSRFLGDYPSSTRSGEAAAMLGWMLVDAGELAAAERSFRAAENDKVDAVRASARKGLKALATRVDKETIHD